MKITRERIFRLTVLSLIYVFGLSGCFNQRYRLNNKGLHCNISMTEVVITELTVPLDSTMGLRIADFPDHFFGNDHLLIKARPRQRSPHIYIHEENPAFSMTGEKEGMPVDVETLAEFLCPGKNYAIGHLSRYHRPSVIILFEYDARGRVKNVYKRV